MLIQTGSPIYFEGFFTRAKLGATGLTVTVNIWRNGVSVLSGNTAQATEVGDGLYSYNLVGTQTGTAGSYIAIFKTVDTSVDMQVVPSMWRVGEPWVQRIDDAVTSRASATALDALSNDVINLPSNITFPDVPTAEQIAAQVAALPALTLSLKDLVREPALATWKNDDGSTYATSTITLDGDTVIVGRPVLT